MSWSWIWIGGALWVGTYAGVMFSLLTIAKQGSRECARGAMSPPARMPRARLRHRRAA